MTEIYEIGEKVKAKFFDEEIGKEIEEIGTINEWWNTDRTREVWFQRYNGEVPASGFDVTSVDQLRNEILIPFSALSKIEEA